MRRFIQENYYKKRVRPWKRTHEQFAYKERRFRHVKILQRSTQWRSKTIPDGRHRHLQEGPNAQTDYGICKNQQNRRMEVNQCERNTTQHEKDDVRWRNVYMTSKTVVNMQ